LNISPNQGVITELAFEAAARAADGIGGDHTRATCYFKAILGKEAAGTVPTGNFTGSTDLVWFNRSG
jgi:hypothetical protein